MALRFASDEALRIALTSGLVPPAVVRAPAQVTRSADGSVHVSPSVALTASAKKTLAQAGVLDDGTPGGETMSCWAEAVPPVHIDIPAGSIRLALLAVTGDKQLLDVAGELLRLGCDRQSLRVLTDGPCHGLVRVVDPPWFTLSRAIDHLDGVRAFVPAVDGAEQVWVELGVVHPLAAQLKPTGTQLVLVTREGPWWAVAPGPAVDVDQLVETAPFEAASLTTDAAPPRLPVSLRLGRASTAEMPALYIVDDGLTAVERLVQTLPEAQLDHVLFAVAGSLVLLRPRPGREKLAAALPGRPFARLLELPNLYTPHGLSLEPPLRRERVRTVLAPDADVVTWLEPSGAGLCTVSVPETAFRPLLEWVDYVLDGAATALSPWVQSAQSDFSPYVIAEDAAPSSAPAAPKQEVIETPARAPRSRSTARSAKRETEATSAAAKFTPLATQSPSEADSLLAREEASFLELEAAFDAPERRRGWAGLAELYARLGRHREAGMAWAHAVWEAPADEAGALAQRWADTSPGKPDSTLRLTTPTPELTRGAVAHLLCEALAGSPPARLAEWAAFFDRFDEDLDVRSWWLGRYALALSSGNDALGTARARDRILTRLQRGLSLDRDVPKLMRTVGQGSQGAGTERTLRVVTQLESMLKAFEETPRKRSATEAPLPLTQAYVQLEFAWGFARLGNAERARALRQTAVAHLDRSQAVHAYLLQAYERRIDQALEGAAPSTPLPPEINERLNHLQPAERYAVDRIRLFSTLLEPQERLDPSHAFLHALHRTREDFGVLRAAQDVVTLAQAIESRAKIAADATLSPEERARLLDGLLDFLPQLPEASALPLLTRLLSLAEPLPARLRAPVLEDALRIAGHYGRTALVKQLVTSFSALIGELGTAGVTELGAGIVASMRSLRRVGLRGEATELLSKAASVLKGASPETLEARLALASGFASLGNVAIAQPIIDEALGLLGRESGLLMAQRLKLSRATARALGDGPSETALPGLLKLSHQLPWITDSFGTNKFFCLSVVDFADGLVMGHVGGDLTLNEATRRFLEEDEYLVRRRIHRDVERQGPEG
jgi:cellulose synthase operon protein C